MQDYQREITDKFIASIEGMTNTCDTSFYDDACTRLLNHELHRALHWSLLNLIRTLLYHMATMPIDPRNESAYEEAGMMVSLLNRDYLMGRCQGREIK